MDNIFTGRHKNITILAIVLAVQFFGLAAQIRRPGEQGRATPLIRTWVVTGITPIEKFFVHTIDGVHDVFANYFFLRGVRKENATLKEQVEQMRLEQVRLQQDAAQAHRLQALLGFKEQFISQTLPTQVIGTSGSDASRIIYIDKGTSDGVRDNMAVITPDGVVGKIAKAFSSTSQVLLISDQSWGAGGILTQSRLQGIVKGTQSGDVQMAYIMSDNQIKLGEQIVTSGGDRIFPKGLPIGNVREVSPGKDLFLNIRVKPAADLNRLEEVLVITKIVEKAPDASDVNATIRASDILAERLPSVPERPAEDPKKPAGSAPATNPNAAAPTKTGGNTTTPGAPAKTAVGVVPTNSTSAKPGSAGTSPASKPPATTTGVPAKPAITPPNPAKPKVDNASDAAPANKPAAKTGAEAPKPTTPDANKSKPAGTAAAPQGN
jgi:rod shape-determining protein MreC